MIDRKNLRRLPLAAAACAVLGAGVMALFIYSREPVLIVSDHSFLAIYGQGRLRKEAALSSLSLLRRVLPVAVVDGASDDIVFLAVNAASLSPHAVIFPSRFDGAARFFNTHVPQVPAIVLEGRRGGGGEAAGGGLFRFRTDTLADFYAAGRFAGILGGGSVGEAFVFLDENAGEGEMEAFLAAFPAGGGLNARFFAPCEEWGAGEAEISVAVLAGAGAAFLQRRLGVPVIFFTWLDPAFTPGDVAVIFNDSPVAQARAAVRLAEAGVKDGQIASRALILSPRIADNYVLRNLRDAAGGFDWGGLRRRGGV